MKNSKVYIFISHSHKDVDKVRVVRNYLESVLSEPILFFLKSKTDEDEITSLIEDEIDARIWFIYCRSKNAEESNWVKKELAYVAKTGKQNCTTIDLDTAFDENGELKKEVKTELLKQVRLFEFLQSIYISYSHRDKDVVNDIVDVLNFYGIDTISDLDYCTSDNWVDVNNEALYRSKAVVSFVSKNTFESSYASNEFARSLELNKNIVPVILYREDEEKDIREFSILSKIDKSKFFFFEIGNKKIINKNAIALVYHLLKLLKEKKI